MSENRFLVDYRLVKDGKVYHEEKGFIVTAKTKLLNFGTAVRKVKEKHKANNTFLRGTATIIDRISKDE